MSGNELLTVFVKWAPVQRTQVGTEHIPTSTESERATLSRLLRGQNQMFIAIFTSRKLLNISL